MRDVYFVRCPTDYQGDPEIHWSFNGMLAHASFSVQSGELLSVFEHRGEKTLNVYMYIYTHIVLCLRGACIYIYIYVYIYIYT